MADARSRGLSFGVCGGRLWVHVSADRLELVHLATTMLLHEAEILGALGEEGSTREALQRGGDHDQPFRFGAPPPFTPDELARLRHLRSRHANRPPDEADPAGG